MSERGNRTSEVHLGQEQRDRLLALTRAGSAPARKRRHARILLLADEGHPDGQRADDSIAAALGTSRRTANRVRRRFAAPGEGPALDRKPRDQPPVPPEVDGRVEAHRVALCCSPAPAGHAR